MSINYPFQCMSYKCLPTRYFREGWLHPSQEARDFVVCHPRCKYRRKQKRPACTIRAPGKILEKRHRDLKTELIFTTELRIPTVTHKSATKSGTIITSFISVQSLRAGLYLWCAVLAGPSFLQSSNWWFIENLGEADLIVNIPPNKIKQDQAREVNMTQYRWKL